MKGFGAILLMLGIIVGLLFNFLIGAMLAVVGLLMIIAGQSGAQVVLAAALCGGCGNPIARTANLCPTCGIALVPTEGPLAPQLVQTTEYCEICRSTDYGHKKSCSRYEWKS